MVFSHHTRNSFVLHGLLISALFGLFGITQAGSCKHKNTKIVAAKINRLLQGRIARHRGHITPKKTIFVFDLDDVILLIKKASKAKFGLYLLMRPDAWSDFAKIRKNSGHADAMVKQNKKPGLVKRLKRIKQSKKPIDGMIEILQELKHKGYELHIASNMTRIDFEFYKKQYPEIFSLFDQAFVVEAPGMPQKPSGEYFDLYRQQHPTNKHHFFVDDKRENCAASGFSHTHVFKNAQQLRADLTARGVL